METPPKQNRISVPALSDASAAFPYSHKKNAGTLAFEIGAWLSGLESFFSSEALSTSGLVNFRGPVVVSAAALRRTSHLCFSLINELEKGAVVPYLDSAVVRAMQASIRRPLSIAEQVSASDSVNHDSWVAWRTMTAETLAACEGYQIFVAAAEADATDFLPRNLRNLLSTSGTAEDRRDLATVLPRFGSILRLLDLVGEMLERDEPLKSSLILFAKAAERIRELIAHLNQLVKRNGGDDPQGMLSVIDAASYMTSIELRKVVNQELSGVISIRPSTTVYARNETAYALLTESFQQILAQFARQVDGEVDIFDLFPSFRSKLEQSIALRQELYALGELTRAAEKEPDEKSLEKLHSELTRFMEKTVRFLFYKDYETFERFVEEIFANKSTKDVTALLHRFAAYVETLFGQVCLRAVLENHPFNSDRA